MNKIKNQLLLKYDQLIKLGIVNREDILNCQQEEAEIYMNIDTDGLLYAINVGSENMQKIKEHLSIDKINKIKELSNDKGETYIKDINMIISLFSLKDCRKYKLLISDILEVSESEKSLTSDLHSDNMNSLYEIITSHEYGGLKEAKTFAILMAATKGKLCKTDCGIDYPPTYLDDLLAIKRATNEDSAYAIGNIMTVPTKGQWDTRNNYINVVARISDYDKIEILTEMATNYYSINSDYYRFNLENLLLFEEIELVNAIIATNEDSLESKYHVYNLEAANRLKSLGISNEEIIEVLTDRESLQSESHMSNIEEFLEKGNKRVKTLKK